MPLQSTCSILTCNGRHLARGWCNKHYLRWWKHGDPLAPGRGQTETERFWSKVTKTDGCWLWTGSLTPSGYGSFWLAGKTIRAHRWAYEEAVGPIPAGLTLDHLCRTHACVRALHLEAVTDRVNILRGTGPPAQNARKTHCIHGHEFTPGNTDTRSDGVRRCRECRRT